MSQSSFTRDDLDKYFIDHPEIYEKLLSTNGVINDGSPKNRLGNELTDIRAKGKTESAITHQLMDVGAEGNQTKSAITRTKSVITVVGSMGTAYANLLNKELSSFRVQVNPENRKLEIIGNNRRALNEQQLETLGKKLSGTDRAIFDAITTDTKRPVTIDTGNGKDDPAVFFGQSIGATHKLDFADLAKLDKANIKIISAAKVAVHETIEAHREAMGVRLEDAHKYALTFAPGIGVQRRANTIEHCSNDQNGQKVCTGLTAPWSIDGPVDKAGKPAHLGFMEIEVKFLNPIKKERGTILPKEAFIIGVREARAQTPTPTPRRQ